MHNILIGTNFVNVSYFSVLKKDFFPLERNKKISNQVVILKLVDSKYY